MAKGRDDFSNLDWQSWRLCNCCECGKELSGESMARKLSQLTMQTQSMLPELVRGRSAAGRPYCCICWNRYRPDAAEVVRGKELPLGPRLPLRDAELQYEGDLVESVVGRNEPTLFDDVEEMAG